MSLDVQSGIEYRKEKEIVQELGPEELWHSPEHPRKKRD